MIPLEDIFSAVAGTSWRAGLLILLYLAIRALGRSWLPRRVLFAGWIVIAIRLLIPVGVPAAWSPYNLARPVYDAAAKNAAISPAASPASTHATIAIERPFEAAARPLRSMASIAPVVWLCGAVGLLFLRFVAGMKLRARIRRGAAPGGARITALARKPARFPQVLGIFGYTQIERRIHMIINHRASSTRRTIASAAALGLLLSAGLTHETWAETAAAAITETAPEGWFENGSRTDAYVVGADSTQKHIQPFSAYVKSTGEKIDGFGGMMQTFSAENYRGKRVRFSAYLKTHDVAELASLWMRIDGDRSRNLQFDNMSARSPKGDTDWTQYSIVLDVPDEATTINFGFFIAGAGQAWVNDARFEVVSNEVDSTAPKKKDLAKAPANLAFAPSVDK